jgi:hypothetical protein
MMSSGKQQHGESVDDKLCWTRLGSSWINSFALRPLMKTIDRLSTVLTILTLILAWAAYPSAGAAAEYRSDGSKGQSTGSVVGTVWLVGAYEKPAPLKVFKNRDFCGPSVANESLLVNRDGGVQNTVIILRPMNRQTRAQPASIVLDNRNCAFSPRIQVAALGSELRLKNSDPILHTVHGRLGRETLFNVGLPRWRQVTKSLTRSGVIRIDCDVLHTWISAAILVTASPYHALTDQHGRFAVERLSAGEYEIETWHEKLGSRNRRLLVAENAQTSVDIVYALNQ